MPIEFRSSTATRHGDRVSIALFDGEPPAAVALLECSADAARGLVQAVGSALESEADQAHDEN